jgi:hypothetical protein
MFAFSPELVTAVKDIVLAACAVVRTVVAVLGLTTWQRQLRGGVEYEVSKKGRRN